MEKKLYLVETISMFRMRYAIRAHEPSHAEDMVVCNEADELSQKHIDEVITSTRQISIEEYRKIFSEDNQYLNSWPEENKLTLINDIEYNEESK